MKQQSDLVDAELQTVRYGLNALLGGIFGLGTAGRRAPPPGDPPPDDTKADD